MRRVLAAVLLVVLTAGCAPLSVPAGPPRGEPKLLPDAVRVSDGAELPLYAWLPATGEPRAVIIALHGFNDYGAFFASPGAWLADRGIASYAYDQRGFGKAPNRGIWPGTPALASDLADAVRAVRVRHPNVPLYVLGESMGGAVAVVAVTGPSPPPVEGLILSAPAVRGRVTMSAIETAALWLSAHTVPGLRLSGRGLGIKPSDNIEMLRALGKDPNVIKQTRVDAVWGLVGLMDSAQAAAPQLGAPTLILYGENDELVPPEPTQMFVARLPPPERGAWRIAVYEGGYHMLLRDLEAERVWADIAVWIANGAEPLPSGADARAVSPGACEAWSLCDRVPARAPAPETRS